MTTLDLSRPLVVRVLGAMKSGHTTFSAIDSRARGNCEKTFRATDRVLQKLRRNGLAKFSHKKGWAITV